MSLPSVLRKPVLASSRPPLNSSVPLPSKRTIAPAGGGARGAHRRPLARFLLELELLAVVGLERERAAARGPAPGLLALGGEFAGGRELLGLLGEILAGAVGGSEDGLLAVELAREEDLRRPVPAVAGQPARVNDGLERAAAERDHLRADLLAGVLALELEVDRQRRIRRIRPDFLVLRGPREHHDDPKCVHGFSFLSSLLNTPDRYRYRYRYRRNPPYPPEGLGVRSCS
jgi:hypothetical protein